MRLMEQCNEQFSKAENKTVFKTGKDKVGDIGPLPTVKCTSWWRTQLKCFKCKYQFGLITTAIR